MKRTRLSLYYLASYLTLGGLGFLIFPQKALSLFFSTGHYDDAMVRLAGVLLLTLGILIIQIIRLQLESLYSTTLIVRPVILIVLLYNYISAADPLMIILFVIVGFGFVITLISYWIDRRDKKILNKNQ